MRKQEESLDTKKIELTNSNFTHNIHELEEKKSHSLHSQDSIHIEIAQQEESKQSEIIDGTEVTNPQLTRPKDYWTVRPPYQPSRQWRDRFISRASCGFVDPKKTHAFGYNACNYLSSVNWRKHFIGFSVPLLLWNFFLSLKVLGTGFKLMGGKDSAKMFDIVNDPLGGLCLGILATVLVQSSSTSTSLIVTAVASGELSVENAVAMVMGANIGTTITNTLVAFFHGKNRQDFKRAISSATVHDLFNFLNVAVLLPIQAASNFFILMTDPITRDIKDCENNCDSWINPISLSVSPAAKFIADYDKKVLKAIAKGHCDAFNSTLCDQPLLKQGLLYQAGLSDIAAGLTCVLGSIAALCACLYAVVKSLHYLMRGRMARMLKKSLDYNPYLTMLIGCGLTIMVQSSSVTTATLTPLCAEGLISLEQMLPLTLGANVGTTVTGLLAASVATSNAKEALQTALSHLLFNLIGIALWYPIPALRKIPLQGAKIIGEISEKRRWFPVVYTLLAFIAIPAAGWAISSAINPPKEAAINSSAFFNNNETNVSADMSHRMLKANNAM